MNNMNTYEETIKNSLKTPDEFDFPFPPYEIQNDFMKNLYSVLENGKLGIFESPTGTGKSLSIICGAIRWLKDHEEFKKMSISNSIAKLEKERLEVADNAKDWIVCQSKERELTEKLNLLKIQESKIQEYEKKLKNLEKVKENKLTKKWKNLNKNNNNQHKLMKDDTIEKDVEEDEDILPEEPALNASDDYVSDEDEDKQISYDPSKIYICSRTHSQLSQFVGEIIKSPFGNNVRVASLASRQAYCINPDVSKLKSMALINERCVDLQKKLPKAKVDQDGKVVKKQKGTSCSCPYYKQTAIEELSNFALVQVQDVEDLVNNAKELNACPYYASRKAAEDAEVIFIPYNTLLHKATREANGIKLKNNIVIVDEAHNLLEALAQMHNVDLNYGQVYHALQQMKSYKNRFNTRFSAKNLLMINQLIFVLGKLFHIMDDNSTCNSTEIFTLENFVLMGNIDNFNMFRLTKFCREARLAQKIRSYAIKYPIEQTEEITIKKGVKEFLASIQNAKSKNKKEPETPEKNTKKLVIPPVSNPLLTVLSFLETLTYSYKDGRILFKKSTDKLQCKLQFLLLDPSSNFTDIVQEARAVVLAGGTMKPNSEFRDRLFIKAGASPDRIVEFSCDHIVDPENILPIIVTKGRNNGNLLFNFENRMTMGCNIKHIIQQACDSVKGGIVVFFPSYNYENWVWQQIKDTNFGRTIFREPQNSGSVDAVLENYAKAIFKPGSTGALLLSVVGGKLSEGLNFSNDLGRCVIVIGLPYANIMAADLKEKMAYLDKTEGAGSGQKFYENQCMKSVNQCIGRAVRHKNDYATVLLVDERYDRMSIKNMLPNWIKKSLKVGTCDQTFDLVRKFFENKRTGT